MTTDIVNIVRLHTTDPFALSEADRNDPAVVRACVECGQEFVPTVGATDADRCGACVTEEDVHAYALHMCALGMWVPDQTEDEWTLLDYLAALEA